MNTSTVKLPKDEVSANRPRESFLSLEVKLQTELNIASWSCGCNRSEASIRYDRTWGPEVCSIEGVEHVRLKTQIEPLRDVELFAQGEIPGL